MRRICCYLLTIILAVCLTGCGLDGCVSVNRNVVIGTTEVPGVTVPSGAESPVPLTPEPSFTAVPTVAPTDEPTPAPTEEPTAAPTEEPTEAPTLAPTAEPTEAPTITPTVVPTAKPTPTVTPLPTPTPVPKEGVFAVNSANDRYSFSKAFSQNPKTFEARFLCNASITSTGEVITGNYKDLYSSGVYFGINPSGFPTLYINYSETRSETFMIPVVVLQNGRHDVAFSIFDDKICGYLDGEMLLESAFAGELPNLTERPFSILGDDTANNSFWFRNGELLELRIFSAPRTAEQIAADFSGEAPADPSEEPSPTDAADETVLVSFDFAASKEDSSNNRNNIVPYWHEGEYMPKDSYKYTIAVVGDIQTLLNRHSEKVPGIFDYILDKKDEFNIKRTIFLGDLTENNSAEEWIFVREQVRRLDNGIPYSLVRGNHDGFIGEHHDLTAFGNYFGGTDSPYSAQYDGGYNSLINNTYKLAEIEGVKYLFMNLDFGPTDDVLKWAGEICSKYPDRQVVISLHSFLFCDGTLEDRLEPQEKYAVKYNSSANIWEKFASNHANVKMILGGHTPDNNVVIRELTGKNGNKVTAILSDPQYVDKYMGGDGIVNLLHFGDDGTLVSIETVSTAKNRFYKAGNQIIF